MPVSRKLPRPIYGIKSRPGPSPCELSVNVLLSQFTSLLAEVENIIYTGYPATNAVSTIIGKVYGKATVSPALLVRLQWRVFNPGLTFEMNNIMHRVDILNYYCDVLNYVPYAPLDPLFKDQMGLSLLAKRTDKFVLVDGQFVAR